MLRILVADDVGLIRDILRGVLESKGHEVIEARDGEECMERLRAEHFDLLVLDMLMPRKDGIEVMREMLDLPEAPPVLGISAGDREFPAALALKVAQAYGALRTLFKPFTPQEFLSQVSGMLVDNHPTTAAAQ